MGGPIFVESGINMGSGDLRLVVKRGTRVVSSLTIRHNPFSKVPFSNN
ncbi:hypothetical protein HYV21_02270 [Candidatus Microgenomates bacterium]|nr:hypothetical protein [Candidatus Microgenomates bacterium]